MPEIDNERTRFRVLITLRAIKKNMRKKEKKALSKSKARKRRQKYFDDERLRLNLKSEESLFVKLLVKYPFGKILRFGNLFFFVDVLQNAQKPFSIVHNVCI